ncbi:MAG: DUF6064 family protein [bacterium]|nr:DUF6064 family protein [bacterium]
MNLPFTVDEFLAQLAGYNAAIWPAQAMAYALGILATAFALTRSAASDRIISVVLSLFWLWTGIVFHLLFFRRINGAAWGFGAGFVAQGLLLLIYGALRRELKFRMRVSRTGMIGALFVLYALLYPLVGARLGHGYPQVPMFGVTPCPLVIFTFGLLLWAEPPVPRLVMLIPFVWSVIGFVAALQLGMLEDIGLLIAGVLGSLLMIHHERSLTTKRMNAASARRWTDAAERRCAARAMF